MSGVRIMTRLVPIISMLFALLGGLWLLQGLGLVEIQPILCFANCEPVQGPSLPWAIVGGFLFLAGVVVTILWFNRRKRR